MYNKYEVKIIGEYTHEHTCRNLKQSCFYYAEGGVVVIFDPTIKAIEYFRKHKTVITNSRKIILCFSDLQIYRVMSAYIIDWFSEQLNCRTEFDVYEPCMYERSVEQKTYIFDDTRGIYMHDYNTRYIKKKSNDYKTNEDSRLYIGVQFTEIHGIHYSFYTLWRCDNHGIWECVLYYNGLSGTLELASKVALFNNAYTRIYFYINHEKSFGTSIDVAKPEEIKAALINTFKEFKNKVYLLGFNNESERSYLKNLWKDDEPVW